MTDVVEWFIETDTGRFLITVGIVIAGFYILNDSIRTYITDLYWNLTSALAGRSEQQIEDARVRIAEDVREIHAHLRSISDEQDERLRDIEARLETIVEELKSLRDGKRSINPILSLMAM